MIGKTLLGSAFPVRVQSMLDTSALDTQGCVEQAARIVAAGGELVRIAVPGVKEAINLEQVRAAWRAAGYDQPLVADVHFSPEAAMEAARHVEKVRVNPGNFAERQGKRAWTDDEYAGALREVGEKLWRFIACCKKHHTAVRVGTNHGSLSDRVLWRYGNTAEGMVEATMEYLRVFREASFFNVVVSLKSSDCRVMVDAVRLLVKRMEEERMAFPLHLGVTEAGEGEDGRVRSAVGIGTLLNEGIGDTIRVSLTEAPEREIPVARELLKWCIPYYRPDPPVLPPRCSRPLIVADVAGWEGPDLEDLDFTVVDGERWQAGERSPELIRVEVPGAALARVPEEVQVLVPFERLEEARGWCPRALPLMDMATFQREKATAGCVEVRSLLDLDEAARALLAGRQEVMVVVNPPSLDYRLYRQLLEEMARQEVKNPLIVRAETGENDPGVLHVAVPSQVGGLFLDRLAHGLWVTCRGEVPPRIGMQLSRDILQSTGVRRYKTEFVSCPGCGRTLFNLQESVREVKRALAAFPGLKIAVMGCVVNGPGEMGDADYGYVGAGRGKVTLYQGQRVARTNVPEEEALEALKGLIMKDRRV
jgi:(E)-4-hydroxy-3-methylbut-2-enyl-diphosphate synthase